MNRRTIPTILLFVLVVVSAYPAFGGGPLNVAGVSSFQPGLAGTPITWANGQVTYYTDQGDLSPLLPSAEADQFVADAFSRWTAVSTAALRADRAGSLDEDVNGTNVTRISGQMSLPADIQTDSLKPLGIVYDADGRVFDALMGAGAGAPELCNTNSVYGEADAFADDGHIKHALVIINGNCANTASQLPILKYRLIRTLGRVLGLDYSQLNDNVVFGSPPPGFDDYAGFPVMHPMGVLCNEANCLAGADQLRMDDRAAISRLYPADADNIGAFAGKSVFRESTGRVSGSVRFALNGGAPGQGMQGVNVVARMVDPVTSRVSRSKAASSVSGFLFRGNAGNPMVGYIDVLHRRYDRFGSADVALQGYFDLAGLEIPDGYTSVVYELSVEPVHPLYVNSTSVGPYRESSITPSGSAAPIRITISRGGDLSQDIIMQGSASEAQDRYEPQTFVDPPPLPAGGNWTGSISGYGDLDIFRLPVLSGRTFTFDVTAIDESGLPSISKAAPVLGAWTKYDTEDGPAHFRKPFNSVQPGTTRLQATVVVPGTYKFGIADYRGDGRPDFRYEARLLYAHAISPVRCSAAGGDTITIEGVGFRPSMQVQVAAWTITPISVTPDQIVFRVPALVDSSYSITVSDPLNGASSMMPNVLDVGGANSRILLLGGANPQVPVGTQAPNPFRVQVQDGYTGAPVKGATVNFKVPSTAAIVGCDQSLCSQLTDENGEASVYVLIKAEGPSVIEASLRSGPKTAVTINGIAAELEIALDRTRAYVAAGTDATISVSATVVAGGAPVPSRAVHFFVNSGTATLSSASPMTNANGVATTSISVTKLTSDVNISACVAPDNAPCRTLLVFAVSPNNMVLQRISGDQQVVKVGGSFAPISVKVVDANANPVTGAAVQAMVTVFRASSGNIRVVEGEQVTIRPVEPVVLATSVARVVTDGSGIATLPMLNQQLEPVRVVAQVRAGKAELLFNLQSVWDSAANQVSPDAVHDSAAQVIAITSAEADASATKKTKRKLPKPRLRMRISPAQ